MIQPRRIAARIDDGLEMGGQLRELRRVFGRTNQKIMVIRARGRESLNQVADVRSDAKIADAPDIYNDPHTAAGAACVFQA